MKYKIQREISTLTQGNCSVMEYFNKLKKLWDEYACIVPVQFCNCEKGRIIEQQNSEAKLIQFLMGLSDVYDSLKNQIMLLNPLPKVNKAYSMILTAERQKNVQNDIGNKLDNVAMVAKMDCYGRGTYGQSKGAGSGGRSWQNGGQWSGGRGKGTPRLTKEEKYKLICEKCGMNGHTIATCFKIHGAPDWYKDMKEQQGKVDSSLIPESWYGFTANLGISMSPAN
ncbi:Unknown protein [Striga hermonthica]|uniref:Retrotransposon gag domain-containing protein n=1 Tax=Striga hermonthica TaxID=68872 RepID=A0A9N7NS86_STRHE|nr:Unknown protein [Striga hermonthica]